MEAVSDEIGGIELLVDITVGVRVDAPSVVDTIVKARGNIRQAVHLRLRKIHFRVLFLQLACLTVYCSPGRCPGIAEG